MSRTVAHLEIGTKIAVGGAFVAFQQGVQRARIREAILQDRVNAYAAARIAGRASDLAARKNRQREAAVSGFVSLFDGHR